MITLQTVAGQMDMEHVSLIQEGKFGCGVVKAKQLAGSPTYVALKVMSRSNERRLEAERDTFELLGDHENILKCFHSTNVGPFSVFVLELMDCDLRALIEPKESGPLLRQTQIKPFFRQIIAGVDHMHRLEVAHLDLKPENMFVNMNGDRLKIGDFDLSFSVKSKNGDGKMRRVYSGSGTDPYRSPQATHHNFHIDAFPCDIWSIGVVLIHMIAGDVPWEYSGVRDDKYNNWIENKLDSRGKIKWNRFRPEVMDLIRKMLVKDVSERATLETIKSHAWLLDMDDSVPPMVPARVPEPKPKRAASKKAKTNTENDAPPTARPSAVNKRTDDTNVDQKKAGSNQPGPSGAVPNANPGPLKRKNGANQQVAEQDLQTAPSLGKRQRQPKREFDLLKY